MNWADPTEVKAYNGKKFLARKAKAASDPAFREYQRLSQRVRSKRYIERLGRGEYNRRQRERHKERYATDPEFRAKRCEEARSGFMKMKADPIKKEKYRQRVNKRWKEKVKPSAQYQTLLKRYREENRQYRKKALEIYGGKCVCCGESNAKFLTIDHVHNDGKYEKRGKDGRRMGGYLRQIVNHPDKNRFQVLCWNCNMGKALNHGVCPHVESSSSVGMTKPAQVTEVTEVTKSLIGGGA